jgi:hypothetical protein
MFKTKRLDTGSYLVRLCERVGYIVTDTGNGWQVLSEVTGKESFREGAYKTKKQAYNAIIDHNYS